MLSVQVHYTSHNQRIMHVHSCNTGTELTGWSRHTSHTLHTDLAQHVLSRRVGSLHMDSWGSLRCHSLSVYNLCCYHFYCSLSPMILHLAKPQWSLCGPCCHLVYVASSRRWSRWWYTEKALSPSSLQFEDGVKVLA